MIGDKIAFLTSEEATKMMENKINEITRQINELRETREEKSKDEVSMEIVMEVVGYFLEHLEFLLLEGSNPLKRAEYFGIIFEEAPTYEEIVFQTPKLADHIVLIKQLQQSQGLYAPSEGFEPPV